jgi:hypothetical protein
MVKVRWRNIVEENLYLKIMVFFRHESVAATPDPAIA